MKISVTFRSPLVRNLVVLALFGLTFLTGLTLGNVSAHHADHKAQPACHAARR